MENPSDSIQEKADNPTNIAEQESAEGRKQRLPLWGWALILIAVLATGYLLIKTFGPQELGMGGLPAEVSVEEVAKFDQKDWFFLDVREPSEWEEAHISYATLIPLGELEARLAEIPKDMKIVVVCQSGGRSAKGRDLLLNSGFTNVTSMAGGMGTWQAKGFPVVTGP